MAQFILEQEEYEALISLGREGAAIKGPNHVRSFEEFLLLIERKNNITRSIVWVQWQELDTPLPPNTDFPDTWPPEQRKKIELITRPVARVDVDQVVAQFARQPENILVTKDPAGIIGYTPIDDFFIT